MTYWLSTMLICLGLLVAMLALLEIGRRLGLRYGRPQHAQLGAHVRFCRAVLPRPSPSRRTSFSTSSSRASG